MLNYKTGLLCLLNIIFINSGAVGDEEIQKMVEVAVKNEVEQALAPQDTNRFLKILGFIGITGGLYFVWTKYGWATKRDVRRELGDGARADTKKAFKKVEDESKEQLDCLKKKADGIEEKIKKARQSFEELIEDDLSRSQETQQVFIKLGNFQRKLLNEYWDKSQSLILNADIVSTKAIEIVGSSDRLIALTKALCKKKKILNEHVSKLDQEYENLLTEVENDNVDHEKIASLIQQNKLSADQVEQLFLKGVCKLNLLIEQAESYKQLNQSTEYAAIHKKIDTNLLQAQQLFDIVNQHKQDLDELKTQLKDIKTDNEKLLKNLTEQAQQINEQDGPVVSVGNRKKRAARFKDSGISVTKQDLATGRSLGWK